MRPGSQATTAPSRLCFIQAHIRGEAAIHHPSNKKGSKRRGNNKGAVIGPYAQRD